MVHTDIDDGSTVLEASAHGAREWCRVIGTTFGPAQITAEEDFTASIRSFRRQSFCMATVTAGAHVAERTARHIANDEQAQLLVYLQVAGHGELTQAGRTARLEAGDLSLLLTCRPYRMSFHGEATWLGVLVPADDLYQHPASISTAIPIPAADPVASSVGSALTCMEASLAKLPVLAVPKALRSIFELIDMLSMHATTLDASRPMATHSDNIMRILRYIEDHLNDPDLSVSSIAEANFISVRTLYSLTRSVGINVAGWIRTKRLETARSFLDNPAMEDLTVAEIGAYCGLTSPAHFSTLFRDRYGLPPNAYRSNVIAMGRGTQAVSIAGPRVRCGECRDFSTG